MMDSDFDRLKHAIENELSSLSLRELSVVLNLVKILNGKG
jgi:hypothetical protein